MLIREIDPNSAVEKGLVANRMRLTLIEVMGEEKGGNYYSMDFIRDRLEWHLDATKTQSKVFIVENPSGENSGHAIARVERDSNGKYGYFSTLYIDPNFRDKGYAKALIKAVEEWFTTEQMPDLISRIVYNTAEDHAPILRLFGNFGYVITHHENSMVQLTKILGGNK